MCGIAGYINLNETPADASIIRRMTDAIRHRGPDGEGQWVEENVAIGHRRLSIIDLSDAGHQPMVSADGRYVLSYNGEIYNFIELRKELEEAGYRFMSSTDSEVVLNAYAHWGPRSLTRFNGMFAFAVWDRMEKRMFLGRDRYGVKPLYYSSHSGIFLFGSEQKAITAYPGFRRNLNKAALVEYFTFQNIFTDQTLLEGIHMMPAGHYGFIDSETRALNKVRYWDYRFREPEKPSSREEYVEELDRLFRQAVKRQLVSDVELGAYLSGGMDSGSITAIAASHFPYLKSFTCGFDLSSASGIELAFDERAKAEAMSARFKTEHYEMVLKSGDMERCLPSLAWHLEEPRVGQSYPNYYAAKLASRFVKVILAGTGGDELFGGYPWRYYRAAKAQSFEEYIDSYYAYWQRLVSNKDLKAMFAPSWSNVGHVWTRDIFRDVFFRHENELNKPEDYINHSLYFEAKTFLHGLFMVEDKLSMAHSLESRVPFMDNDLVDFAMRCPVGMKLNNLSEVISRLNENDPGEKPSMYFQKTNDGKQILRDVMKNYIPVGITRLEKQGFSSPDASWFKGESLDFVKRKLFSKNARIYEHMDYLTVVSLLNEHLDGRRNRRLLIWSLLNIEQMLADF